MSNPDGIAEVRAALARAKWNNADAALATLLLRHGNLTNEAREWIARLRPPQCGCSGEPGPEPTEPIGREFGAVPTPELVRAFGVVPAPEFDRAFGGGTAWWRLGKTPWGSADGAFLASMPRLYADAAGVTDW